MPSFKTIRLEMTKLMPWTKNYSKELSNSRANNYSCSGLITPTMELIQDPRFKYILTKFGTHWLTKFGTHWLTKFGTNWFTFVDVAV